MTDLLLGHAPALVVALLVVLTLAVEGALLLGLAVPGTAITLTAGAAGVLPVPLALAATVTGALAGGVLGFGRGRRLGARSLPLARRCGLDPATLPARRGAVLTLGPWLSCGRVLVPRVAGAHGVARSAFVLRYGSSAAAWAATLTTVGHVGGAAARHHVGTALGLAVPVVVAVGVVVAYRRRNRRPVAAAPGSRPEDAIPGPAPSPARNASRGPVPSSRRSFVPRGNDHEHAGRQGGQHHRTERSGERR